MSEAILEVCGLTCERGERTLFQGLTFSVESGTLVRIAGSNGAGKTTLLRLMTGLMRPVEGEVRWRGEPVIKAAQDFWRELCYIGHRNGVKDDLSVLENVLINTKVASLTVSENEALDALDQVGLTDFVDVPAGQLSQGQRRRVALARLWLSRSVKLWVLDEPFTALDVKGVARLAALIGEHVKEGGIVMLVTHQEVPVEDARLMVIEPEKWSPRRRTAVERALDDANAAEAQNAGQA
ncbi:MAG: cytochrome c biogenesis heme-transporting ATPase CcmA [Sutterella sp.]|nr:cytochrome c biogenesis heme-transporting ATPase CcmA [Sutterella sp.]